jgi:hypothetical protein
VHRRLQRPQLAYRTAEQCVVQPGQADRVVDLDGGVEVLVDVDVRGLPPEVTVHDGQHRGAGLADRDALVR